MALFNRNSGSEIPSTQVEQQNTSRNWLPLLIYLLLALLVAALVVFSGRWVYQKLTAGSSDETTTTQAPESSEGTQRSEPQGAAGGSGASPQQLAQNPQRQNSATPTPPAATNRPSGTPSPAPSSLPNNGPGHVIALFIGTSFVAGGLHYIVTLRRLQQV